MNNDAPTAWLPEKFMPLDHNGPANWPYDPCPQGWVEQPAARLFQAVASANQNALAVVDPDGTLTYGQLLVAARVLAARLAQAAPGSGAIGILLPNAVGYPVALLACLFARRTAVLLDANYPAPRNAAIIAEAGLAAVIASGEALAGVPGDVARIPFADNAPITPRSEPGLDDHADDPDRPAFVIYTSGSTGRPKGIVHTQRSVLWRVAQLVDTMHSDPSDRILSLASPCVIDGVQDCLLALLRGATLCKIDLLRTGLRQALLFARAQRPTILLGLPSVLRALVGAPDAASIWTHLRCVRTAGDALTRTDWDSIRAGLPATCHILSVYGATEAAAMLQWFVTLDATWPGRGVRLPGGYPVPGYRFSILDENGCAVAADASGELVVNGRFMAVGEWRDGQCVPGRLSPDPENTSSRILRTGDLVQQRADGLFMLLGRIDRQMKIGGMRVEPAEVEAALRGTTGVADAVVVALRMADSTMRIVGFVVPTEPASDNLADLVRERMRAMLPAFMRPSDIVVIDVIPHLPGGKVDVDSLLNLHRVHTGD